MNFEIKDIEQYLSNVKEAVENDRYRLDRNAKRLITSICFWIMLLMSRKQNKSY